MYVIEILQEIWLRKDRFLNLIHILHTDITFVTIKFLSVIKCYPFEKKYELCNILVGICNVFNELVSFICFVIIIHLKKQMP